MERDPLSSLEQIAAATAREHILIAAWRRGGDSMEGPPDKIAALLDTTRALAAAGVRHALIGGVAVGIQSGAPRATVDTDIAVLSTTERTALVQALTQAGFRLTGEFAHSANFRHAGGEPVQIAFDTRFDPMIARAEHFDVGGVEIPIVTKADLIAMKRQAASDPQRRRSKVLRDQADIELLLGDVPDPDEGW
jgi:hypothetical protein